VNLLIFLLALSVLVLVHEFGHYIMAVKFGISVEEFGLGLPPRLWGKKFGKTIVSLNWLPIGGFCKLYGEDGDGKGSIAFNNRRPIEKMWVVLGGVLMNVIMAIIIFSVVYFILGVPKETDQVKVLNIASNSPAEMVGIQKGDWIMEINDTLVNKSDELVRITEENKGQKLKIKFQRNGVEQIVEVEARLNPPEGQGSMGVSISNMEMVKIKWYEIYKGIGYGFKEAYYWGRIIVGGVSKMILGLIQGQTPKDVSGPLGMYEATAAIKQNQGMLAVIHFFGIVSVNLAIVNILPFPALDGGRIIFVLYEMITKRKANQKFEATINSIGMWLLLTLILMITVGDIRRLVMR
jgi:regulator of sigma E protease